MAGTDLRAQLNNFIKAMHDQGILDEHFEHVKGLQNEYNPYFVLEIVSIFCRDAENVIAEVTKFLDEPVVDYVKTIGLVHQLRGGSSSLGGSRMAIACRELRQATQDNKKEECLQALEKVKREFSTLHEKLNVISQMERTILTNEGSMVQCIPSGSIY
ncbi:histidine-containing phosphotransfer protein 2-like [Corylus avellana]|uniref:histidine-containing phosphotransfer protein 2-like n=1 Tax=Corylus avellana TaxID=13451 RepID=UPI001E20C2AD|nr:histidine-containing phosphotransfer protein 2-like [Corylus avellana]